MGLWAAMRDFSNWKKQADRSVPTPWKRATIDKGPTPGNIQRLNFVVKELGNPVGKTEEDLEYLRVELAYFKTSGCLV